MKAYKKAESEFNHSLSMQTLKPVWTEARDCSDLLLLAASLQTLVPSVCHCCASITINWVVLQCHNFLQVTFYKNENLDSLCLLKCVAQIVITKHFDMGLPPSV